MKFFQNSGPSWDFWQKSEPPPPPSIFKLVHLRMPALSPISRVMFAFHIFFQLMEKRMKKTLVVFTNRNNEFETIL